MHVWSNSLHMKGRSVAFLALVLVAVSLASDASSAKDGKLRIGVKKRPESCTTKSRKGDTLTMHYTVRTWHYVAVIRRSRVSL